MLLIAASYSESALLTMSWAGRFYSQHSQKRLCSSRVMRPRLFQHVIVRCRLVLVIIRFHVVLAHREIPVAVPHQDAPQIGVPIEGDAVEVVSLALLKLGAAPNGRERRHARVVPSVRCAQPQDEGAVL